MTPELRLIAAPVRTYAMLARQPSPLRPAAWLRRPLLACLAIGLSMAIAGTGHVTPALVLRTTAAWSFVIVLQIAIAFVVVAAPARRTVGIPRALDLFFASHAPWSLWMLGAAAMPAPAGRPLLPLLPLALIPLAITVRAIRAFFREVLRLDGRGAVWRTAVHQAITWTTLGVLYGASVALQPRIVGALAQWFAAP
ncbi:MAG TPA: hypothetical protein VFK57_17750 [Vicinamibacterales bacterium]|nr:hypothetical protein [Vicinamibacterales bacterium]